MADGLLDFLKTPEGQGLLSAGFAGLANARRGRPINTLGAAGLAGVSGYSGALEREAQLEQMKKMGALRDMQISQTGLQTDQMRREAEKQKFLEDSARQFYSTGEIQGANFPAIEAGMPDYLRTNLPDTRTQKPAGFDMAGYTQAVAQKYPLEALRMQQAAAAANELKLAEGETIIDRSTGKPKFQGAGKLTDDLREYNYARQNGFQGSLQDWILSQKKAGAPQTNIQMGQEKAEAQTVGKAFGEQYAEIQKAGFSAQNSINRYDRLNQLLDGVSTGKFTPLGLEVAKGAKALGVNIDPNLSNKEAAAALSNELALQLRNPSGGAGMPGAMSDSDRSFLSNMVPGLGTTPEGRALMIEAAKKMAKRDQEVAKLARNYRQRKGTLDEGFYNELADFAEKNPLFPANTPAPKTTGAKFLGFE